MGTKMMLKPLKNRKKTEQLLNNCGLKEKLNTEELCDISN